MNLSPLADKLRPKLPWPIWNGIRKCVNAILGPANFSLETGHFHSCLKSLAVDKLGNPLPWFTYPAIQFLLTKDLTQKRVLEWGAGQSTLFWSRRAKDVVAFEADPAWYGKLKQKLPSNATLHLVSENLSDLDPALLSGVFDVIIVDGLDRFKCAEISLKHVAEGGVVIVDNSDGNHGPRPGYGIINLYNETGFSRVDFYGYVPGNSVQHCTSFFYRTDCFLMRSGEVPKMKFTVS
jgi:hypothetical protein